MDTPQENDITNSFESRKSARSYPNSSSKSYTIPLSTKPNPEVSTIDNSASPKSFNIIDLIMDNGNEFARETKVKQLTHDQSMNNISTKNHKQQ